jgi:hypothetical protein
MQSGTSTNQSKRRKPNAQNAPVHERRLSDLGELLQGLSVVAEEKQARRVSSSSHHDSPIRIPNPIPVPTPTEEAFWNLVQSKAKAVA